MFVVRFFDKNTSKTDAIAKHTIAEDNVLGATVLHALLCQRITCLAASTRTPQEGEGIDQPLATVTTQEGDIVTKPHTERFTNNVASDPLVSTNQERKRKAVVILAQ